MSRVIHFELNVDDPERAARFYSSVFGWTIEKWDGPLDYWLVMTGDRAEPGIDGAMTRRLLPGATTVNTIDVDDLNHAMAAVIEAGGQIVSPRTMLPGVGFMCYAQDPEGNLFGMMESSEEAP
jgi:hypothetical protein